jgi:DNA-binding MurR/RpiR family transcriptional regulator
MKGTAKATIAERIRASFDKLTPAERVLVNALLANYPMAGLASITEFARTAKVSTPTVLRTAKKLGFTGFPDFQARLRQELEAQLSTPLAKHEQWAAGAPAGHILNQFAAAVIENLRASLGYIDHRDFDRVADLLGDRRRSVHIVGGRITRSLAQYLFTHLQVVRPEVFLLPESQSLWPQHLLSMEARDVLVIFDVRRYDAGLLTLAELAQARGVEIVLFTDQWMSPISSRASHALPLRIEVPSSWDSGVVTLFIVEALIAAVVNALWPDASHRIEELETLFGQAKRLRR